MSYDVDIGKASFNYTYNMSDLFYDVIPSRGNVDVGGIRSLHGLNGKQALERLSEAVSRIERKRIAIGDEMLEKQYNAKNGWGTVLGATLFLAQIMAACIEHPDDFIEVS